MDNKKQYKQYFDYNYERYKAYRGFILTSIMSKKYNKYTIKELEDFVNERITENNKYFNLNRAKYDTVQFYARAEYDHPRYTENELKNIVLPGWRYDQIINNMRSKTWFAFVLSRLIYHSYFTEKEYQRIDDIFNDKYPLGNIGKQKFLSKNIDLVFFNNLCEFSKFYINHVNGDDGENMNIYSFSNDEYNVQSFKDHHILYGIKYTPSNLDSKKTIFIFIDPLSTKQEIVDSISMRRILPSLDTKYDPGKSGAMSGLVYDMIKNVINDSTLLKKKNCNIKECCTKNSITLLKYLVADTNYLYGVLSTKWCIIVVVDNCIYYYPKDTSIGLKAIDKLYKKIESTLHNTIKEK